MLNKEIFIKRNIDPPSPLLRRVDKRFPHLLSSPRFHNNSLSWDFQHLSAPFTHSFLSFCLFVFCPADTKLCGTDTWASSKAVSSKCFTTEAYFFPCLFFPLSLPPPPTRWCRYLSPSSSHFLCFRFVSGDNFFTFSLPAWIECL